jgi:hypothetical protein
MILHVPHLFFNQISTNLIMSTKQFLITNFNAFLTVATPTPNSFAPLMIVQLSSGIAVLFENNLFDAFDPYTNL